MRAIEMLHSVLLSVKSNKVRVFLTSLGIIIGTFTIIMVVGIGVAGEKAVEEQYKRLSVQSITISQGAGGMRMGPGGVSSGTKTMTKDQAMEMPNLLDHVRLMSVSVRTSAEIAYGSESQTVNVLGVNEAYAEATNLTPMFGEFLTDEDGSMRNKVCVLGYNVAEYLFGDDLEGAVGETVMCKGATYKVIGVLERIGGSGGIQQTGGRQESTQSSSADDMILIPYEVAVRYVSGGTMQMGGGRVLMSMGSGSVNYIALAEDIESVQAAISEIKEYIMEITGSDTMYDVQDAGSVLASAQETAGTMSSLLMAVAAIVLLVSGIGIMNVLLVAVKERTTEIGILKSMGANRKTILLLFIYEAIFISLFGGVIGVGMSWLAPYLLKPANIDYLFSVRGILLGLIFSMITGMFFGIYPAVKASKQLPIEALNYE